MINEDEFEGSSYGYNGIVEALNEYEADGGWFKHCQMRAAIILDANFSFDEKLGDYLLNKYGRHLEEAKEGWEKMWHYGNDTKQFITDMVNKWIKEYEETDK
jgi:hypothetical protein